MFCHSLEISGPMAQKAREENDALVARLAELEARLPPDAG
jgi:BMFP domain-containing protein YqiC